MKRMSSTELLDVISHLKTEIYEANNESNFLESEVQRLGQMNVMKRYGFRTESARQSESATVEKYSSQNNTESTVNVTELYTDTRVPSLSILFPHLFKL